MIYNLNNLTDIGAYKEQCEWFLSERKIIEQSEIKEKRTGAQNRARWKYLQMIADILNERGETFEIKGLKIECPFTKDNIYEMYWQTLRNHMYPGKTKQLNTKEFTDLVEMVKMMFAKVFQISIPFPNWQDYTRKEDEKI